MKKEVEIFGHLITITLLVTALHGTLSQSIYADTEIIDDCVFWQAHGGGGAKEAPDNTMAAFTYTWNLGGIPEADIRTTKDGLIICLHDHTLARTTTAPKEIRKTNVNNLTFKEIRKWDAGVKFRDKFKGEQVPSLKEVFGKMKGIQSDRYTLISKILI